MAESDGMRRLGEAIDEVRTGAGLSQTAFGDLLEESQQTVSEWVKGRRLTLDDLRRIEEQFKLPRGWFVTQAGYVDGPDDVELVIARDRSLGRWRREVLAQYRYYRQQASEGR